MITVLELLQSTTKYLEKHGVEQPRLNVEHLLAHSLGLKRLDLYMQFDRPLSESELQPLRTQVRKRSQGVPLQHLLGTVEFHGLTLKCDARALIPRPETELFVEMLLERTKANPPTTILDVGTGSGAIALALAAALPTAQVTAVDISPAALSLARENAELTQTAGRIRFLESDLLAALPAEERFDLITANLPYVTTAEMASISREVQQDPVLALAGGSDGLDVIRRFLAQAPSRMQPGGLVALEIGHGQGYALTELLREGCFVEAAVLRDYQGLERFVFAHYG